PGGEQNGNRPRPLNIGQYSAHFSTRFAASAQAGQAQTAGALAPCRLWYTGTGRQSFRLSPLSASTLGAALLRCPALSSVPGRQKLPVYRKTDSQPPAGSLTTVAFSLCGRNSMAGG